MQTDQEYQNALDLLYSYVDYSLKHSSELAKAEFNLERMRDLMRLMGNPQNKYKVIHITGTKGKGSTAAMCAAGLRAAGYKVGLYTSPHLLEYTERIQVDGTSISKEDLIRLVKQIKPLLEKVEKITTFEVTTALGFAYFAEQAVDWAVIEVGLGGRLDATNIVDPEVSVITTISYDHTAILGNNLEAIASEKGGIIKPNKPVVIGPQKTEAMHRLLQVASANQSLVIEVTKLLKATLNSANLSSQKFNISGQIENDIVEQEINLPLIGSHQMENALTAFATLSSLKVADSRTIADGFRQVVWPCRFEVANLNPVLIFDSAHNEDAFRRLAETIWEYLPGRKVVMILGISEDKHLIEIIEQIKNLLDTLIVTRADHPRALPIKEIIAKLGEQPFAMHGVSSVPMALTRALDIAQNNGSIVVSAGSMFVTAEVKKSWIGRQPNGK